MLHRRRRTGFVHRCNNTMKKSPLLVIIGIILVLGALFLFANDSEEELAALDALHRDVSTEMTQLREHVRSLQEDLHQVQAHTHQHLKETQLTQDKIFAALGKTNEKYLGQPLETPTRPMHSVDSLTPPVQLELPQKHDEVEKPEDPWATVVPRTTQFPNDFTMQQTQLRETRVPRIPAVIDDEENLSPPLPRGTPQSPVKRPVKVAWDFGAGGCAGWALEAISMVTPFMDPKRGVDMAVIVGDDLCEGLPERDSVAIHSMRAKAVDNVDIFVSHKPPSRYPEFPYVGLVDIPKRPPFVIGRSMTEVDRPHADWPYQAKLVDEIWVPSAFLRPLFLQASVPPEKVLVIPEPIDTELYDLKVEALPIEGKKGFNFISVFKWEVRKAWDVLLKAYFHEFKPDEDVALYLHTYLYGEWDPYDEDEIKRRIVEFARSLNMARIPPVRVVAKVLATHDMPRLYKAMDAFVLPSRGEGWGRPAMEAMTMGLPCIATNWSGMVDFMNDANSFPIPLDPVNPMVQVNQFTDFEPEQRWANPSFSDLRKLMRFVFTHREEAKRRGEQAHRDLTEKYNRDAVADILQAHFRRIALKLGIDTT